MPSIRAIRPSDDREAFDCGEPVLNAYLQRYAVQNHYRHYVGTTYFLVADDERTLMGFVTISPTIIDASALAKAQAKRVGGYEWPALRLCRLAVDKQAQGQGVAARLIQFVFAMAWNMAEQYGCKGVVVDAKPGKEGLYARFGFEPMQILAGELGDRPIPTPMFLAIKSIPRPEA